MQHKYIHHHFVGMVGRATFRENPGEVDMDTVPAPGRGAGTESISTSPGVSREVVRPTSLRPPQQGGGG